MICNVCKLWLIYCKTAAVFSSRDFEKRLVVHISSFICLLPGLQGLDNASGVTFVLIIKEDTFIPFVYVFIRY